MAEYAPFVHNGTSLPSRERGLKLQRSVWNGLFHLSLPSRERGLEFS